MIPDTAKPAKQKANNKETKPRKEKVLLKRFMITIGLLQEIPQNNIVCALKDDLQVNGLRLQKYYSLKTTLLHKYL